MRKPEKILIIRTDRLGDVILSTPVIKNLRIAFPNSYLAFMCRPYTKEALEGNPDLDEIIVYDKYGQHKNFLSSLKFAFSLRKKKFDWAIILHPTNRAHLLTFLAAIPFRIGWNKKMGFLLTKKIPHQKQKGEKHEMEYTLDILRRLNIPITDKNTYFPIKEKNQKRVEEILNQEGIPPGEKFIVIHPCASCPSKRWPPEYFSQLIKLLNKKSSLKVIVIAAQSETKFTKEIITQNPVIDLSGKLSISEIGSLIKRAAVFISNDSGPVHIASAVNTPVIAIFGRKNAGLSPVRWKPLGEKSFYFHKDAGCVYCLAHNCLKKFLCLKKIKPEEVAEKALSFLK